jgi:PAS domain S-box-containing protein
MRRPSPTYCPKFDHVRRGFREVWTRYRNQVLTTRSVHKDGSKLYVELSFGLVRDGSGTIIGSLAIGRDCTARHLKAVARSSASCAKQAE